MSTYICIYNRFFPHKSPGFPSLQWSFKTSGRLYQCFITLPCGNRPSLWIVPKENHYLLIARVDVTYQMSGKLSLLLTCLISTPSKESVLILQSRMCAVQLIPNGLSLDWIFTLFGWIILFHWNLHLCGKFKCMPLLHFKKKRTIVFIITFELQLQLFVSGSHNRQLGQHC